MLTFYLFRAIIPRFGWRWLVVATAFPLVFSLLGFPFIGESPKFFLASNQIEKAVSSLEILARRNKKDLPNGNLINDIKDEEDEEEDLGNIKNLFPNFFYFRLTTLICCIWMLCSFCYYGVILLSPSKFILYIFFKICIFIFFFKKTFYFFLFFRECLYYFKIKKTFIHFCCYFYILIFLKKKRVS